MQTAGARQSFSLSPWLHLSRLCASSLPHCSLTPLATLAEHSSTGPVSPQPFATMIIRVVSITILLAALLCTAVTLAAAFPARWAAPARRASASASTAASPIWLRTELFFGLSRNVSGVLSPISDAEFDSFLDSTVTPLFPAGSSVIRATGWFPAERAGEDGETNSDGGSSDSSLRSASVSRLGLRPLSARAASLPLLSERSAIVILFHSDDGGTAAAIRTIWSNYTTAFNQRSVLVSSQYSRVCFNDDCPSAPTFVQTNGCGSGAAGANPPDFQDAGAWRQASYPDDPAWLRTEALFSLGFDADPSAGLAAWAAFLSEVIAPTFPDGFTVVNVTGRFPQQANPPAPGWSTDDASAAAVGSADALHLRLPSPLLTGPARQLIAFHPDSRALAQRLHALWPAYQSRFVSGGQPSAPTGPASAQLLSAYSFVCNNDQCAPTSVFGNCSALSALIAAGALANGSLPAVLPSDSWDRTEMFFGLSVQSSGGSGANTTGRISDAVFQSFVDTIIVPQFLDPLGTAQPLIGLNLVNASGQYLNDASVLIKEPSVQLTLTHVNSAADAEAIRNIWINYTIEYQQESVLIDTQRAQVCFNNVC